MLDKLPLVSIIVLNWNGRAHLADCFDSLLGLDYPHELLTLMLVDNGSIDDSIAFMREHYPQVTLVVNDHNLGFAGGNNTGARAATTDYIAFLNNDAHVYPDWLSKLIEAIQSDPEVKEGTEVVTNVIIEQQTTTTPASNANNPLMGPQRGRPGGAGGGGGGGRGGR